MNASAVETSSLLSHRAGLSRGQPIGRLMAQALNYPNLLSLAAGFVDNATLPCAAVQDAMQRLGGDALRLRKALQYDAAAGNVAFRSALADWSYQHWPVARPEPNRVILTAGSNQLLHLLVEALIDPGDIVLAAAPTYFVFLGTVRGAAGRVVGIAADEDGMCIDSLEKTLQSLAAAGQTRRVKAIYVVTDFDNPAGSSLSLHRREQLLEVVRRWRREHGPLLVLSDNAYQHLRFDGPELPPLLALDPEAAEFVIELGTFSKSFSPGIRVGWGVVPETMVEPLLEIKSNMDFGSPHFSQVLMWEALSSGEVDRHLPDILRGYRLKRDSMLAALDKHLGAAPGVHWRTPHGGLYVWLTLPEAIDAAEHAPLWTHATRSGVLYVPGVYCFPPEGQPAQPNTMRLSYGVLSASGIDEAIARLATALGETSRELQVP